MLGWMLLYLYFVDYFWSVIYFSYIFIFVGYLIIVCGFREGLGWFEFFGKFNKLLNLYS